MTTRSLFCGQSPHPVSPPPGAQPSTWRLTDEERELLERVGFKQSKFTTTRWVKSHPARHVDQVYVDIYAWIDRRPDSWALTTFGEHGAIEQNTLGLELIPMIAFAMAEGWL